MAIGPLIRSALGPLEKPVSNMYRGIFISFKALHSQINEWLSFMEVSQVLEVGCGEGAVIELLSDLFPNAQITGIDITPRIGRLYKGDLSRVRFRQETIKDFAYENKGMFDFVVIIDVLHHIPPQIHKEFLTDTKKALKKGGVLLLKDWTRSKMPIHLFSCFMERYVTGDKVHYLSIDELRCLIREVFGENSILKEAIIPPWKNNIAFLVKND